MDDMFIKVGIKKGQMARQKTYICQLNVAVVPFGSALLLGFLNWLIESIN